MLQDKYLNLFTDFGFKRMFKEAQIPRFDRQEQEAYEDSLKVYRDLKNVLDTARDEAFEEGKAEGLAEGERRRSLEIARSMKALGLGVGLIQQITGLNAQDIERL